MGFILALVVWVVVGIVTWNSGIGAAVGGLVGISCILYGAITGFAGPLQEAREKQRAQKAEELREQERRKSELRNRLDRLSSLLSDSRKEFLGLREMVPAAERHLDKAEQEFAEGAFAPFWDEIERATKKLAGYQNGIETINRNAIQYREQAADLPARIPPFDLPTRELPDGRATAIRLETIVRKAQKNFQFATIYEQRKTNQILIGGFGTLASAIYAIGDSITSSLEDLSTNLHRSLNELLEETREHSRQDKLAADRHIETLTSHSKQAVADATKRRQFEQEVIENQEEQVRILDNIQRGRKPFP